MIAGIRTDPSRGPGIESAEAPGDWDMQREARDRVLWRYLSRKLLVYVVPHMEQLSRKDKLENFGHQKQKKNWALSSVCVLFVNSLMQY